MLVSTQLLSAAGFSTMRRVKTYLRATIRTTLGSFSNAHVYKDMTIDGEARAHDFCRKKNKMLNFGCP